MGVSAAILSLELKIFALIRFQTINTQILYGFGPEYIVHAYTHMSISIAIILCNANYIFLLLKIMTLIPAAISFICTTGKRQSASGQLLQKMLNFINLFLYNR